MTAAEHILIEAHDEAHEFAKSVYDPSLTPTLRALVEMAFETGYLKAIRKYVGPEKA